MFKYLLILLLLGTSQLVKSGRVKHKNILFIVADDLGWADLGYGNLDIDTPNIDFLAQNGIILNQSYAYPVCTPSRASFLSGVFAERTGLQHAVLLPNDPIGLPTSFKLLPEILKKQFGYATHGVGKWHLGHCNLKYTPAKRGFDSFYGFFGAGIDYYTHRIQNVLKSGGVDFWNQTAENLEPIRDKDGIYSMFAYTERAVNILENHDKSKPFFLYYASQNVHSPMQVPESYEAKYKHIIEDNRRKYLGMVSVLDEVVGNLTRTLNRLDLLDNTLIIFTSDNGGSTLLGGRNVPLKGGKTTVFEGGTRVRAFVYGKDLKPYVNDGMFHAVDWMPTMLHAAIGTQVDVQGIDGVDQWPSLTKNLASKRSSFIYNIDQLGATGCQQPTEAIRDGDWKLIRGCPGYNNISYLGFNSQTNANINTFKGVPVLDITLYNIKNDPSENRNVARNYPNKVKSLIKKIEEYKKIVVEPQNGLNYKRSNNATTGPGWC